MINPLPLICKMIEWMNLGELKPFIKSFNPILPWLRKLRISQLFRKNKCAYGLHSSIGFDTWMWQMTNFGGVYYLLGLSLLVFIYYLTI